ncbi:MAG: hypothetical protein HFH68_06820 [Lachnospiraceae bacterium]|nr:hypothetical protein [Lachnospiraceae bacterium]
MVKNINPDKCKTKNKIQKTNRHILKFTAVVTLFSICTSLCIPATNILKAADTSKTGTSSDKTSISRPATGSSISGFDDLEESQSVELSLNYSDRKIIYGSCQYLDDFEAFDASAVTIDPGKAEWRSSDESVATVKYGTVFIQGTGKTVISVIYEGNIASCNLEVIQPEVSIDKEELKNRLVGDKCTDWYSCTADVKVSVKSGNKNVVKVKDDGSLKVLALGKSLITVKAENGNTASYTMNIKKRHIYVNDDETLNLDKYIKHIKNYKDAVWTVSDPESLQVSEEGDIKPLKCGKTSINTSLNGKKYKINIRVTNYELMKGIAMEALKDTLRYPASLSVNNIFHDGRSITIDYSSMNKYGGYDRDKFIMKINMTGEYSCETVSIYN